MSEHLPHYPQSNGKIRAVVQDPERRVHTEVKTPLSLEDARRLVAEFVIYYNTVQFAQRDRLRHVGEQAGLVVPGHLGRAEREAGDGQRPGGEPRPRRKKIAQWPTVPARYTEETWAEDRATRGRDPSADSGAKTGEGGTMPPPRPPGIGPKAINPFTVFVPND